MHVDQVDDEVGIDGAGGCMERRLDRAGHLKVVLQRLRGVDEHILTALDRAAITHPTDREQVPGTETLNRTHGIEGVVGIAVGGLLIAGWLPAQQPITAVAVGMATTTEIERSGHSPAQGPLLLIAPDVAAHHIEQHRTRRLQGCRCCLLEVMLKEPLHLEVVAVEVNLRHRQLADAGIHDVLEVVVPGPHQQAHITTTPGLAFVVEQVFGDELVVPAADHVGGHLDRGQPPLNLSHRQAGAQPAVALMHQRLEIRMTQTGLVVELIKRQVLPIDAAEVLEGGGGLAGPEKPAGHGRERWRTATVLVAVLGAAGHHRHQTAGPGDGRAVTGEAQIGDAGHGDPPIRPARRRRPFDRIEGVVVFTDGQLEAALGAVTAAHILGNADIAAPGQVAQQSRCRIEAGVHVVGTAQQQHRMAAVADGAVDMGAQGDAIAHRHHHPFDHDLGMTDRPGERILTHR